MKIATIVLLAVVVIASVTWIQSGALFKANAIEDLAGYFNMVLIYPIRQVGDAIQVGDMVTVFLNGSLTFALSPVRIVMPLVLPSVTNGCRVYVEDYELWAKDYNTNYLKRFTVITDRLLDLVKRSQSDDGLYTGE